MRTFFLAVVALFVFCGVASAAYTDPHLEKTLKTAMIKKFKTAAPGLKFTTMKCVLPKNGVTAHCKASFTDRGVTGYYPVTATLHDSGKLTWTAQSPKCLNTKTKKYVACS